MLNFSSSNTPRHDAFPLNRMVQDGTILLDVSASQIYSCSNGVGACRITLQDHAGQKPDAHDFGELIMRPCSGLRAEWSKRTLAAPCGTQMGALTAQNTISAAR